MSSDATTLNLQELITSELRAILGEEGVEILTEYVWHMLVNPDRQRDHLIQELQEFLAEETEKFVDWSLITIAPKIDSYCEKTETQKAPEPTYKRQPFYQSNAQYESSTRTDKTQYSQHLSNKSISNDIGRRQERPGRLLGLAVQATKAESSKSSFNKANLRNVHGDRDDARRWKSYLDRSRSPYMSRMQRHSTDCSNEVELHQSEACPPPPYSPYPSVSAPYSNEPVIPLHILLKEASSQGFTLAPMCLSFKKLKKRCAKWPGCTFGDSCRFIHPSEMCTHWPHCPYGAQCFYIHPETPCKFGLNCRNMQCNYNHPSNWDPSKNLPRQTLHATYYQNKTLNLTIQNTSSEDLTKSDSKIIEDSQNNETHQEFQSQTTFKPSADIEM